MLSDDGKTKLSFIAEWFDPQKEMVNKFLLKYYPKTQEVEMKDLKGRKFLKPSKINLPADDFVLGAIVVIFSRDLKLLSYGDDETRLLLEASSEKGLAVLNNCSARCIGKLLSKIDEANLTLVDLKTCCMDYGDNEKNTGAKYGKVYLEVRGKDAVALLEGIKQEAVVSSIEQDMDMKETMILPSASKDANTIKNEFEMNLKQQSPCAKYELEREGATTCCAIKPHAIKSHLVGNIVEDILARDLDITAMQVVRMDRTRASEFYEVYRKVTEYHGE